MACTRGTVFNTLRCIRGASCLLKVGRVVFRMWGELSFGQVVLFPMVRSACTLSKSLGVTMTMNGMESSAKSGDCSYLYMYENLFKE